MNQRISSLSIVLPAYNEEAVIAETVGNAIAYGKGNGVPFEVIVVNDGSRDSTFQILEELQKRYGEVRVVNHEVNKGYGEALRSGFNAARMDWLFLMDSDGQFDIRELDAFLHHTDAYEMILGYREDRADTFTRVLLGEGYTFVMNALFGMRFKDIDCAFKLFQKRAWEAAQPILSTDHKIFSVEWLWNSKRKNLRIKELPAKHFPRLKGSPTGARGDVIWQMVKSLIKLRFR